MNTYTYIAVCGKNGAPIEMERFQAINAKAARIAAHKKFGKQIDGHRVTVSLAAEWDHLKSFAPLVRSA